ncbi:hypothetical protein ACN9MG_28840 [Burkholderia ambifaria]|jgi:hypothetical protein|uniref:hypothetical protein n=1 Tax=Burkholderia TaxID=32008 RepID=UPI00158EC22C|nr:hypothetical protein [Burkholderia ambifaria]
MNHEIECLLQPGTSTAASDDTGPQLPAVAEDELVFEAKQKITLRCGKASITLYPNGKIALRGEYIVSDAAGVNRIAGGQIELN